MLPAKVASLNNCKCSRLMIFKYRIKIIAVVPISYAKKKNVLKIYLHTGVHSLQYTSTHLLFLYAYSYSCIGYSYVTPKL